MVTFGIGPFFALFAIASVAMVVFWLLSIITGRPYYREAYDQFDSQSAQCGGTTRTPTSAPPRAVGQACSNSLCRHVNRPGARFCSQCGMRLG